MHLMPCAYELLHLIPCRNSLQARWLSLFISLWSPHTAVQILNVWGDNRICVPTRLKTVSTLVVGKSMFRKGAHFVCIGPDGDPKGPRQSEVCQLEEVVLPTNEHILRL